MTRFIVCNTYTSDKYMTPEKVVESWRNTGRWGVRDWETWMKTENISFSYTAESLPVADGNLQHWITTLDLTNDKDAMMLVMRFPEFHGQAYKP